LNGTTGFREIVLSRCRLTDSLDVGVIKSKSKNLIPLGEYREERNAVSGISLGKTQVSDDSCQFILGTNPWMKDPTQSKPEQGFGRGIADIDGTPLP
jgi:hypothetical protein